MPWHALRPLGSEIPQRLLKHHSSDFRGLLRMLAALCRDWVWFGDNGGQGKPVPWDKPKGPGESQKVLEPPRLLSPAGVNKTWKTLDR